MLVQLNFLEGEGVSVYTMKIPSYTAVHQIKTVGAAHSGTLTVLF
jgi:hypothetical protein